MFRNSSSQRWLAVGLLVLVMLTVFLLAIMPLISTGLKYHEHKQDLLFRLRRARQIIMRKESVFENFERIKQQYQQGHYFSTRNTVALASADLQKLVKTSISQAGGQLTSTQVLANKNEHGFNRIAVKVRMTGDIEVLRNVLHEIETSTPIKIIDQIDIRPVRGRRNRKTRKIEPSNKLNINFEVVGFMRVHRP